MAGALYDQGYLVNYYEGDQAIYRDFLTYRNAVDDIFHVIRDNETLHDIAREYYGSSYYWYIIADVNDVIDDIFSLPVNETIVIPSITRV